jgi:hypothetical protein
MCPEELGSQGVPVAFETEVLGPQAYPAIAVPPGTPAWITPELVQDTRQTLQPYYPDPLTVADAIEILQNVAHLLDALE